MHIGPSTHLRIARLFHALAYGERIAQDCARRQAAIAPNSKMRRFLLKQAQQEGFHALIFEGAVAVLAPKMQPSFPAINALEAFNQRLKADLDNSRFADSLLGMQVVLEGLGSVVLNKMDMSLSRQSGRFSPFRRLLLQQEDAHHAFGLHSLEQLLYDDEALIHRLRAAGRDYLELSDQAMLTCSELFQHFDSDPGDYSQSLRQHLPDWLEAARS